jgi:hypothetical protein
LIWEYNAAIFIKKPRDINFSAELHLLVADADIQSVAGVIFKSFLHLQAFSDLCRFPVEKIFTTTEPPAVPHSIYLKVMNLTCFNMITPFFSTHNPNSTTTVRSLDHSPKLYDSQPVLLFLTH